ncbi:MAG TPA: hypothetical protein VLA90_09650 [Actinomycetota bacterium]|nr:hypothetical protein [Actinomycetota bacterium]
MAEPDASTGDARAASPGDDDARRVLERELYWAGDPNTPTSHHTRQLRIALHDFVARMRADERSRLPRQEPLLGSDSRWKRSVKALIYQSLRPVTHRYDRLLADLAVMTRQLSERLADAEEEIASLRKELQTPRKPAESD